MARLPVLHFLQMDPVTDHVVKLILDRQAAECFDRLDQLCVTVNVGVPDILVLFHLCCDHADHLDDAEYMVCVGVGHENVVDPL